MRYRYAAVMHHPSICLTSAHRSLISLPLFSLLLNLQLCYGKVCVVTAAIQYYGMLEVFRLPIRTMLQVRILLPLGMTMWLGLGISLLLFSLSRALQKGCLMVSLITDGVVVLSMSKSSIKRCAARSHVCWEDTVKSLQCKEPKDAV